MGPRRTREEAAAQTRQLLIDAGMALVAEQPAGNVLSHIKAQAVASRAGLTIGAFYHHWPSQRAYIEDLLDHALAPGRAVSLQAASDAVAASLEEGKSFADTALRAATANAEAFIADPFFPVQLLLAGLAKTDPAVRTRLEVLYQDITASASAIYELLLAGIGRQLRPPVTMEHFAGIFTAAADGVALRELSTPGALPADSFAWMITSLVPVLTREPGDERDVVAYLRDALPPWAPAEGA